MPGKVWYAGNTTFMRRMQSKWNIMAAHKGKHNYAIRSILAGCQEVLISVHSLYNFALCGASLLYWSCTVRSLFLGLVKVFIFISCLTTAHSFKGWTWPGGTIVYRKWNTIACVTKFWFLEVNSSAFNWSPTFWPAFPYLFKASFEFCILLQSDDPSKKWTV